MHRQIAAGLLVLASAGSVLAGRGEQEPAPGALAPDGFVRDLTTRAGIPGLQAAVAIDGRLAWEGAFGKAASVHPRWAGRVATLGPSGAGRSRSGRGWTQIPAARTPIRE